MAYKVIILYQLYMPSYFLGTFTEYPCLKIQKRQLTCNELVALNFLILGISLPIFRIAFFVLSIDSGNLWEIHRIALKIPDRNKIY